MLTDCTRRVNIPKEPRPIPPTAWRMRYLIFVSLFTLVFNAAALAADPTFWSDVHPVLRKHCTVCHSEKNRNEPDVSAGLALDSLDGIKKGAKKPIVVSGKATESPLIAILRHPNLRDV